MIAPFAKYRRFRGENEGKKFAETSTITKEIRKVMRPRFSWRPYVLRAFFDTELLIAESRGKMTANFRSFFMGHKGNIEAKYTTNKGRLPEALITAMRDNFEKSQEYLDLEKSDIDPLQKAKRQTIAELSMALEKARTPEELAKVQELVSHLLTSCNTQASDKNIHSSQNNESSLPMKQKGSSEVMAGSILAPCQMVRSS